MAPHAKMSDVRRDLEQVMADHQMVRISRALKGTEPVTGFVVGIGIRWLLLHRLSDDLDLDGYTAVRGRQISRVRLAGRDDVGVRALETAGQKPVPLESVDPTTTGLFLRSAVMSFDVLTLHPEERDPSICWIGDVTGFGPKSVDFSPVSATGHRERSISLPFSILTRVDLGGRFPTALARVAGPVTPHLG